MDSVDHRMLSFIAWRGEVPREARRIEDYQAMRHAAPWVRRHIGLGVAQEYVIGFQMDSRWWVLFFERVLEKDADNGAEVWKIESYDNAGSSWKSNFYYWVAEDRWQLVCLLDELRSG